MNFSEKTIKSSTVYDGKVFKVKSDVAQLPDGCETKRDLVVHNGGVGVIAVDGDRNITLVRQYRYGAGCETFEIPAGKLEAGENPLECGKRELLEETGYVAQNMESLGIIYPTPAYCSEKIYIYLATELTMKKQKLDPGEFLEVVKISLDKAYEMVMNNEISDAKTVVSILKAKNLLG